MSDDGYYYLEEKPEVDHATLDEYRSLMEQEEKAKVVQINGKPFEPEELQPLEEMAMPEQIFSRMSFSAGETLAELAGLRWLIDGILPADSFGVLYGESGTHKSFITLDMAASIASGKQWHEFDIDTAGGVLYIAAEGSHGLLQRVVAWENKHQISLKDKLAVVRMPILADNVLMAESFVQAARMASERMGVPIVMVVVDTLARSFQGDENSAKDIAVFIGSCDKWRSQLDGATVLVVAHTGKQVERGIRGSSAIKAACDFSYIVKKTEKLHSVMHCDKSKDGDEPEDMHFVFDRVEIGIADRKGRTMASLVPKLDRIGNDDDEADSTATGYDVTRIIHKVKALEQQGRNPELEDVRKWFIDMKVNEYKVERDRAGQQWRRALNSAVDGSKLIKHGHSISTQTPGGRDPWEEG